MTFPPRVLVFVLCLGVGYFGTRAFTPAPSAVAATKLPAPPTPVTGREAPVFELPPLTRAGSALIAEWEKLREEHGGVATDWAALFLDLKKMKDPFRRRAFQAALIAEWAAGDPRAALAFLQEKGKGSVTQFFREWLRLDPQAAISAMLAGGGKVRKDVRDLLSDIARVAPERLAEVVATLPKSDSPWDTDAQDAFAIFARRDPAAALAAAESVSWPEISYAVSAKSICPAA